AAILVAAFWEGGAPPAKPAAGPAAPEVPAKPPEPPSPPDLLGVERTPPPPDDWHGARVGEEGRKALEAAAAAFAGSRQARGLQGRERAEAELRVELETIWGTAKMLAVPSADLPWVIAVEEPSDAADPESLAAGLREFAAAFRARFAPLFAATPPAEGTLRPIIVLRSRDEYLRLTRPPAFATGHTNLNSGWAFVPRTGRPVAEGVLVQAARQEFLALARARAPREGIPLAGLAPWFWDGAAAYFGLAVLPDGAARHAQDVRDALREGTLLPLPRLLAVTRAEAASLDEPRTAFALQPQAWAFTAFLETAEGGKRRGGLDRYAERELSGKGGLEAARECFGDLEALDAEYRAFVRSLK
ncbi:MAG: hypothetical protein IT452_17415, partial [Planctomycetia bacterium]|nr:hypothetical protein [Planctomycetia bacterium]